jgi:hypothetical protein
MTFRDILIAEIVKQKALIKRMDYPPNSELWGNGIMSDLRAERLALLERLLEFEPEPTDTAPSAGAADARPESAVRSSA